MTPQRRQKVLLSILGVLLLATLWRYLGPTLGSSDDTAPPPPRTRLSAGGEDAEGAPRPGAPALPASRRSVDPSVPTDRALELQVAALDAQPRTYTPGRDPWRFGPLPKPPEPAPPPPPSAAELARQRAEAEEAARRQAEEAARLAAEQARPKPPPFTLRYLGSFGPAGRQIAVFSDGSRSTT